MTKRTVKNKTLKLKLKANFSGLIFDTIIILSFLSDSDLPVSQLRLPDEVVTGEDFLQNHSADDIPGVDVNSADGHHLLSLSLGQTPQ